MSYRRHYWALLVTALFACAPALPPAATPAAAPAKAPAGASELELRLAYLRNRIETARAEAHVPGMAVAVIRGGEIVFAEGFGTADMETKKPVTKDTLFMVGSTTKAFTATLLGMLVDEGKIGWDDPLSKHVPLKLKADGDREATLRDALSHRTGFPRMTLLLFSDLPVDEIYAYANKAKPSAKIGEKWQYNNVMYLTAGDVSARVTGKAWNALVKERLFDPLGMASATASLDEAKKSGRLSRGYAWNRHSEKYDTEAARDIGAASPAGAIVANVHDMAKWIRFNMAGGTADGKALISKAQLAEMHKTQMKVPGGAATYGFGWGIRKWADHRYLTHSGGIDGFNTRVGFLPKAQVGFVVLTNTTSNSMIQGTGAMVFEAMLTDAYKQKDAAGEDLGPYLGKYVADFAPFDKGVFTVKEKNGKLAVDVPGQKLYELKAPDKKGQRHFVVTDAIFVTFAVKDGKATTLELTQGGMKMEIWREGVEPESDLGATNPDALLGEYKASKKGGPTVTILVHRGRLALDVPGQPRYVLRPPVDKAGEKWIFRGNDKFSVTFEKENELTIAQPGVTTHAVRKAKPKKSVTLDDVLKRRRNKRRGKALANMGHTVSTGTMSLINSGATGNVTWTWSATDAWREDIKFETAVSISTVSSKSGGWMAPSYDESKVLHGDEIVGVRVQHPMVLHADWSEVFDDIKLRGMTTKQGKRVAAVVLTAGRAPATTAYVDMKTGDVIAADIGQVDAPTLSMTFSRFRSVRGLRIPHAWEYEQPHFGKILVKRTGLRARQKLAPDTFASRPPTK